MRLRQIGWFGSLMCVPLLLGCGDGTSTPGDGAVFVDQVPPTLAFTCTQNPCNSFVGTTCPMGTFSTTPVGIEHCTLHGTTLDVLFGTTWPTLGFTLRGVAGPGVYQTDGTDQNVLTVQGGTPDDPGQAATGVSPAGTGDDGTGNPASYPARTYSATITVQTNLLQIVRSSTGTPFGIGFDVTIGELGTAGNWPTYCTAAPATFHASVAACEAYID